MMMRARWPNDDVVRIFWSLGNGARMPKERKSVSAGVTQRLVKSTHAVFAKS